MKELFRLRSKYHGKGPVTFAWQPDGGHLATAGINGTWSLESLLFLANTFRTRSCFRSPWR